MADEWKRRRDTAEFPPPPLKTTTDLEAQAEEKLETQPSLGMIKPITEENVLGIDVGRDRRSYGPRRSRISEGLPALDLSGNLDPHIQKIFNRHKLQPQKRAGYQNWLPEEIETTMRRRQKLKKEKPELITDQLSDEEYKNRLTIYLLGKLDALVEQASEDERLNPYLLTRYGMEKKLREKIKEVNSTEGKNKIIVLLAFDLDDFKIINDLHGHATGDELLRSVGRAIDLVIRSNKGDVGAHYSGDEFGCMLEINAPEGMSEEEIKKIVDRITSQMVKATQLAIRRPARAENETEKQEISTGYTIIRNGEQKSADIIKKQADEAARLSKIIRIIEENRGRSTESHERLINFDNIERIKREYGYTNEEIAKAEFIWSQRRAAQRIAPHTPTEVLDQENAKYYQRLVGIDHAHAATQV